MTEENIINSSSYTCPEVMYRYGLWLSYLWLTYIETEGTLEDCGEAVASDHTSACGPTSNHTWKKKAKTVLSPLPLPNTWVSSRVDNNNRPHFLGSQNL